MLFSSIAVLNGCGENCHPSLTDRSEAQALPQALSTAKVFINWAACARWKMAICSVNMLSVDSGREGEMVVETGKRKGGLARKKRQRQMGKKGMWGYVSVKRTERKERKTLSECSKAQVVKCQAHFSRLCLTALSFLRIHTVPVHDSHYPSASEWHIF